MKARYYILTAALLFTGIVTFGQRGGNGGYRDDRQMTIVSNFHPDNDFLYSSRIRRFHNSFETFSYYSPVYTDIYWYNYQPFTWGVSIYGGFDPLLAYSYSFPVISMGASYRYSWYDPYDWYWDNYYPYYSWNRPAIININIFSHRPHNYWSWNFRNRYFYEPRPAMRYYSHTRYNNHSAPGYAYRDNYPQRENTYNDNYNNGRGYDRNDNPVRRSETGRVNETVNRRSQAPRETPAINNRMENRNIPETTNRRESEQRNYQPVRRESNINKQPVERTTTEARPQIPSQRMQIPANNNVSRRSQPSASPRERVSTPQRRSNSDQVRGNASVKKSSGNSSSNRNNEHSSRRR